MDLLSSTTDTTDPVAEVRRLRRQLRRERALRQAAESIGERATEDFYDSVRELRSAQSDLLERDDQTRVVNDLARALRQDLDSAQLVNRAAESVGQATVVDRCDVMLVDAERYSAIRGTWSCSATMARLPRPESFVDLPEALTTLLLEAAQAMGTVQVDDVLDDPRLDAAGAGEILEALGVRALAAVPVAVGDEVVGWLLLQSVEPRGWQSRELAIGHGISHDLVVSLMQVQAFEQQRESVRRLEELDRAKDTFISTVSHELRTPLTSIVGYLELINDGGMGPIDDGLSATMGIIERNVGRLRSLVEDLLTLSEYDSEQLRLDLTRVDLSELVADARQSLMPSVVARGLEIAVEAEPGLPLVMVDRTQFDRVVLNLLDNAVKFSHEGGRITVVLRSDGEEVVLEVIDLGIGVPAEQQARLFTRFFRSSLSVAGEIQGTGLGLALVRSVVEWHDGTVALTSSQGRTTVTVRLPCSR